MKRWLPEQKDFIAKNVKGVSNNDLLEMFNAAFPEDAITREQLKSYKANNKVKSGLTGRFEKGNKSWNKGKKGMCAPGSEKGWFQKGRPSNNKKPIGSERICSKDGYVLVKVRDDGPPRTHWQLKHKVVWEREHGSVPKGKKLKFLNGDRTDVRLENLVLISDAALARFNQNNLETSDPELNRTNVIVAEVITKIGQKKVKKDGNMA